MDVSGGGNGGRRSDGDGGGGGGVVVGSVWEKRMRSDQVKGGIKVFGIVDGLNDDVEDRGVKIKSVCNLEERSMTVRKSRRTWRNRDEQRKNLDLHPGKEFYEFEEACKELGVCHVGRVKSGSGQKLPQKFREVGNGGKDDGGDDEFFDDEGLEGDGLNDGNEEVDFEKINGPNKIRKSCRTEQQRRTKKVVSGDKKVNNHFPYDGKPKSIHVTEGSPPPGSGLHKECREQDSSDDGCAAEVRIVWQSLVDLVMWRDVTQTALVFGLGTLVVLLSFFAGKLDISFVSLISHLGFFALATIFICKSISSSDGLDQDETAYSVREEEALNFTRVVLPRINDVLLKFRAVLSGDPAITIKLAVILFVIARWVDYLSVSAMLKLGFFGAFTVPKLYSKYSKQIHGHGISWIQHIEDAWDSCSRKRAIALVAFLILWNFSSTISRVCLIFLAYLALRYHELSELALRGNSANSRPSPVGVEGKGV